SGAPTTPGDFTSYGAAISQDGSTIAFTGQDSNLVQGQHPYDAILGSVYEQHFVAKRTGSTWASATLALMSHDSSSVTKESASNPAYAVYPGPVLSEEGHWVAYVSVQSIVAGLLTNGSGMGDNVYLYDTTQLNSLSNNILVSHVPGSLTQVGNAGPSSTLL